MSLPCESFKGHHVLPPFLFTLRPLSAVLHAPARLRGGTDTQLTPRGVQWEKEHKQQQQKQLWCFEHRSESEKVVFGHTGIFLFLRVESESKCVIRIFCGLPMIWAKALCTKTNRTGFHSPSNQRGGDRTGAAVATTLLLENEHI